MTSILISNTMVSTKTKGGTARFKTIAIPHGERVLPPGIKPIETPPKNKKSVKDKNKHFYDTTETE